MYFSLSFKLLNTDYKHDSAAYKVGILSYAGMHRSCFLSFSISSQHTISSFCFGQEEGQNFKDCSILQKGLFSVFHLELLRVIRTGNDNLFFILSLFHLHHHLDGVSLITILIPSYTSKQDQTYSIEIPFSYKLPTQQ